MFHYKVYFEIQTFPQFGDWKVIVIIVANLYIFLLPYNYRGSRVA
jgi:hypothetical protein